MSDLPGLLLLLGIALALLVIALACVTVCSARRPPRHSAGYALARRLPLHPEEVGVPCESWTLDRPGGVGLPIWEMEGAGPGPTAVLVHGWGQSRIDMLARIEPWRSLCTRIVTYDQRGHGDAGGSSDLGHAEVEDLRALLGRLGDGDVVLAGYSLGAAVTLAAGAAGWPSLRGVVAVGAYGSFRTALAARVRERGVPAFPIAGLAMAWFRLRGLDFPSVETAAARLSCPLFVLHGAGDTVCPPEDARRIAAAARDGRFVLVEDAGHLDAHEVAPDAYHDAIRGFVADLAAPADRAGVTRARDAASSC